MNRTAIAPDRAAARLADAHLAIAPFRDVRQVVVRSAEENALTATFSGPERDAMFEESAGRFYRI